MTTNKTIYQAYPVGCKNWATVRDKIHDTLEGAMEMARWYLNYGHAKVKVISIELPSGNEKLLKTLTA